MFENLKLFHVLIAALLLNGVSHSVIAQDPRLDQSIELVFQLDQEVAADRGLEVKTPLVKRVAKQAQARVEQVSLAKKISSSIKVTAETVSDRIVVTFAEDITQAQLNAVKSSLLNSAWIEFALLANEVRHAELIKLSKQPEHVNSHRVYRRNQLVGLWCPVALDENRRPAIESSDRVVTRVPPNGKESSLEYLIVVDPVPGLRLTSRYFEKVEKQESGHGPQLSFKFNKQGGTLMKDLTSKNLPSANRPRQLPPETDCGAQEAVIDQGDGDVSFRSRLAIIIDGEIHMAPTINGVISTSGVVSGNFTNEQLDALVKSLSLAPLEVPLLLVKE